MGEFCAHQTQAKPSTIDVISANWERVGVSESPIVTVAGNVNYAGWRFCGPFILTGA